MFGKMTGNTKQGWALFASVSLLFLLGAVICLGAEQAGNPQLTALGVSQSANEVTLAQPGGNMEGKEMRFGIGSSTLFATITTDASCGAVNSFLDSYTPLGGMVPLVNIGLGEIVFGGVGSGLYGLIVFAILAVFIAGLMVGRTPEYLGKKIEQYEMKMAALAILILPLSILGFSALAIVLPAGTSSITNPGPHGLTEVLYAYTSQTGNNGSAFAGLASNTPFYNWTGAFAMLIGRFAFHIPVLALAGSLVAKKVAPAGAGTFPTDGALFAGLVVGVILIVGALTFVPAYSLGPIIEHLLMLAGKAF
jgi:K+-transporting ATPase ATPase A chain